MPNKLSQLEINEVSLVDKGAIREVFTVIKSENQNNDLLKQYNSQDIVNSLQKMSDENFTNIMKQLLVRYDDINKEGNDTMNEEIKKMLEGLTETFNKNFSSVNKTIDELQKAVKTLEEKPKEPEADPAQKACAPQDDKVTKSLEALTLAVGQLVTKMDTAIAKSAPEEPKAPEQSEVAKQLAEQLADITKKLEAIEKADNGSNQVKDDLNKNDKTNQPKEVFWKSVLGVEITEQ